MSNIEAFVNQTREALTIEIQKLAAVFSDFAKDKMEGKSQTAKGITFGITLGLLCAAKFMETGSRADALHHAADLMKSVNEDREDLEGKEDA